MDELKHLNLKGIENIEIPEGLEERLSMKIDLWADEEEKNSETATQEKATGKSRTARFSLFRTVAVAASIILAAGITAIALRTDNNNPAHKDTFDNPETACIEAKKALSLLAYNLEKGMNHLEKAKEISNRTNNIIDNTLKSIE
jgi:hypothetical protein